MKKSNQLNNIITRLKGSTDAEETQQIYKEWSVSYNQDLDFFGYVAPQIGVEIFHQAVTKVDGLVFDAGCGTGLCGRVLAEKGYPHIHGADFSEAMRAEAQKTGHYEKLMDIDFRFPLKIAEAAYNGVICFGVYGPALQSHFLTELIRITKTNGIICLSCRFDYFDDDLLLQAKAQEKAGLITIKSIDKKPYMTGQQAEAAYMALQKT